MKIQVKQMMTAALLFMVSLGGWAQNGADTLYIKSGDFGENNSLHYELVVGVGVWSSLRISGTGALNMLPPVSVPLGQLDVSVEGNITSIGDSIFFFYGSTSALLFSFAINANVTSIGNYAFAYCNPYWGIGIPSSVVSIGDYAYMSCMNFVSFSIPNGVKSIGSGAFSGGCGAKNPQATSVSIPSSVEYMGGNPWGNGSPYLTSINVASDNANYASEDGILYNKDKTILIGAPCGKKDANLIPNSVITINDSAFFGSELINSITIPKSVKNIGEKAFFTLSLKDLVVEWETPLSVSNTIFYNTNLSSATLHVPYGTKALYQADPVWGTFGTIVEQAPPPALSLSVNSLNYVASGEQKSFTITSNTDWTVNSNALWLTVSPASGSNTGTINVTAAANTATTQRTAIITVGGTGVTSQTINVTQSAVIPVASVTLNKTAETLIIGETLQLTATVVPANATNPSVRWSSSNESVAAVSTSGLVTSKAAGTAVIIVTTVDGGFTASCSVTVNPPAVAVTGISLDKTSLLMWAGGSEQLTATVTPVNATNKSVRWSSSNEAVATVSASGLVSAKAVGTAVVIATTVDGGFTKMCNVEVGKQDIETPGDSQTGTNGKGTINLSLTIPGDATVTGSFIIQFPEGLTLDEQLTVLSAELSGNFSLTFTSKGNNTWLIEIKTSGLRSSSETPAFKKIMDIAYKVSSGIQKGTYQASVKNLDFKLDDGTPIQKDLIPVTINVSQSFTSIDNINNTSFYATIINNVLKIESPQKETIKIYSSGGVLLFSTLKNAGTIEIPVSSLKGSVYIVQGSISGVIKVIK